MRVRARTVVALILGSTLLPACAAVGSGTGAPGEGAQLVPPGYGTLRQDQVTLSLRDGDLLIKATPLAESVIRVTAPDTYARLHRLTQEHGPALVRRSGVDRPSLFLVSFFSYEPDIPFEPEDVHLLNRGLRFRPLGIDPVTARWGAQRLDQEETEMAIYAFDPGIDLEQNLTLEYQDRQQGGWDRILQVIQAERARVLARAQSGG